MFRFMIRDVLWLTVVVAVLTVGWLDRRQLVLKHEAEMIDLATACEEQLLEYGVKLRGTFLPATLNRP